MHLGRTRLVIRAIRSDFGVHDGTEFVATGEFLQAESTSHSRLSTGPSTRLLSSDSATMASISRRSLVFNMKVPEIENWISTHQSDTDATLETIVRQKVPHCVDHRAARELLHRRQQAKEGADFLASERRHSESISVSLNALKLSKFAIGISLLSLLMGAAGLLRSLIPPAPTPVLPVPATSVPSDRSSVSKPNTKSAVQPTTQQQSPDQKTKAIPPSPVE